MYLLFFVAAASKKNDRRCTFTLPCLKRGLKSPVKAGLNWVISGPFRDIPVQSTI